MARQRNIAPGFFRNEDLGECSPLARLLFAGLWCWADRLGRLEDRPRRLRAEILPYDSADGEELVAELTARGFLRRYEVAGVRVIQIVHFERYQKPHPREAPSVLPDESGVIEGGAQGSPKADPGSSEGEPEEHRGSAHGEPQAQPSPASSLALSPSRSLDPLASLAGERAGANKGLGPLGSEVVAAVACGLGLALKPLRTQADADEFEERIALFADGAGEAIEFFKRTCRSRDRPPSSVKVLLLMLRDLVPDAKRTAGGG